jgi:hypothetical protein
MEIKFTSMATPWPLGYGGFADEVPKYHMANYWARIFKSLKEPDEPYMDFYRRIADEWKIVVVMPHGNIEGVMVDDAMMTALLLRFPVQ